MLATLIYSLDSTIAAVAVPHMQGTLPATQEQVAWVLTSYIVVSAIVGRVSCRSPRPPCSIAICHRGMAAPWRWSAWG